MNPERHKPRTVSLGLFGACLIAVGWVCVPAKIGTCWAVAVPTELKVAIGKAVDGFGPDVDPEPVEGELLLLTSTWKTPEERAAIYAALAEVYSTALRKWGDEWKIVGYAQKALKQTADPQIRYRLYLCWAHAYHGPIVLGRVPKDEFPDFRRKAAVPYLHALAIAAENLKITQRQNAVEVPAGVRESGPLNGGNPAYSESAESANQRIGEELKGPEFQNQVLVLKPGLNQVLARLYSTPPYATEELKRLATEIVKKAEMVKEIMDATEAKIKEKEAKGLEKEGGAAAGAVEPKETPRDP